MKPNNLEGESSTLKLHVECYVLTARANAENLR